MEETIPRLQHRKRKSKAADPTLQTPDLNVPAEVSNAIVQIGLVNSRVSQLDGASETSGDSMLEMLKKQKRSTNSQNARLAVAFKDSPRRTQ